MDTSEAVAAFLDSRRARGCSPKTISWYDTILRALVVRCTRLPDGPGPIEQLLAGTAGGDENRFAYWRALRTFYRWAAVRFGCVDAMVSIGQPLRRRKVPPALSEAEVLRVMAAARSGRDKALLTLLLDTGVRIGEAASLSWADVQPRMITVRGKVGEREVPISEYTRWVLLGCDLPWAGRKGPLRVNGLQQALRRCLRRAGISRGSCHILRHTFARLYLRAGGDVFSLQRIMGHADIGTTRIYAELERGDIVAAHAKYSPIVRLLEAAAS